MARPRKNQTLRAIEGAQPSKLKTNQPPASSPVGDSPSWLTGSRRTAWYELCVELQEHLTIGDRAILEIAASIRGDLMAGVEVGVNKMALLRQCMKDLGASPTDRQRLNLKPKEPEDPDEAYFFD